MNEYNKKLPVGIPPKNIWIHSRIDELISGIHRRVDGGHPVPSEWYLELRFHLEDLGGKGYFQNTLSV